MTAPTIDWAPGTPMYPRPEWPGCWTGQQTPRLLFQLIDDDEQGDDYWEVVAFCWEASTAEPGPWRWLSP